MTGFTAQPDDLRSAAPAYDATADRLADIFLSLTTTLELQGACWGNDEAGRLFAGRYVPGALSAVAKMDTTNTGLRRLAETICSWARAYIDAQDAAQASAAGIAGTPD